MRKLLQKSDYWEVLSVQGSRSRFCMSKLISDFAQVSWSEEYYRFFPGVRGAFRVQEFVIPRLKSALSDFVRASRFMNFNP